MPIYVTIVLCRSFILYVACLTHYHFFFFVDLDFSPREFLTNINKIVHTAIEHYLDVTLLSRQYDNFNKGLQNRMEFRKFMFMGIN